MSKPERRFKCGPITISVWAQGKTVNGEMVKFYSVKIDKTYKDSEEWKHTNSFAAEDLLKVSMLAAEAYKYLRLRSSDEEN